MPVKFDFQCDTCLFYYAVESWGASDVYQLISFYGKFIFSHPVLQRVMAVVEQNRIRGSEMRSIVDDTPWMIDELFASYSDEKVLECNQSDYQNDEFQAGDDHANDNETDITDPLSSSCNADSESCHTVQKQSNPVNSFQRSRFLQLIAMFCKNCPRNASHQRDELLDLIVKF
jgi:hypothetical protein